MVDVQTRVDRIARAAGEILSAPESAEELLGLSLVGYALLGGAPLKGPRIAPRQYKARSGAKKFTRTLYADVTFGDGKRRAVSLGTDLKLARLKLREILGEIAKGRRTGPLRLSYCLDLVRKDQARQQRVSQYRLPPAIRHIQRWLGDPLVESFGARGEVLSTGMLQDYQTQRMTVDGAAAGTVQYETAIIGRGLHLARERGELSIIPKIPHLRLTNARKGWFAQRSELEAIIAECPRWLRAFVWACYYTGWRPKELLSRQWTHVDLDAEPGWIALDEWETKNGKPRLTPIMGALRVVLLEQRAYRDEVQREKAVVIPWLFFGEAGERIVNYRHAWHAARTKAGHPTRLVYDCRATRISLNDAAGLGVKAGMEWVGHTDMRTHLRYTRGDRKLLARAVEVADAFEGSAHLTRPKVESIAGREKKA